MSVNKSSITQGSTTPTKVETVKVINSMTPLKSERNTSIQISSRNPKGDNNG